MQELLSPARGPLQLKFAPWGAWPDVGLRRLEGGSLAEEPQGLGSPLAGGHSIGQNRRLSVKRDRGKGAGGGGASFNFA